MRTVLAVIILACLGVPAVGAHEEKAGPQTLPQQPWIVVIRTSGMMGMSGRNTTEIPAPYAQSTFELPYGTIVSDFQNLEMHLTIRSSRASADDDEQGGAPELAESPDETAPPHQTVVITAEQVYHDVHDMATYLVWLKAPAPPMSNDDVYDLMRAYHGTNMGELAIVLFVPAEGELRLRGDTVPHNPRLDAVRTRDGGTLTIKLGERTPTVVAGDALLVERKIGMIHVDLRDKPLSVSPLGEL
jgi:hypothetical protein